MTYVRSHNIVLLSVPLFLLLLHLCFDSNLARPTTCLFLCWGYWTNGVKPDLVPAILAFLADFVDKTEPDTMNVNTNKNTCLIGVCDDYEMMHCIW